jgi:transcriptional regulator with XRE-family HTH domain
MSLTTKKVYESGVTGSELKAWRMSLGMSVESLASATKIEPRSINRMEANDADAPPWLLEFLTALQTVLDAWVASTISRAPKALLRMRDGEDMARWEPILKSFGVSHDAHCAALWRVKVSTACKIGLMDSTAYTVWLAKNSCVDSVLERANWWE